MNAPIQVHMRYLAFGWWYVREYGKVKFILRRYTKQYKKSQ